MSVRSTPGGDYGRTSREAEHWTQADQDYSDTLNRQQERWRAEDRDLWKTAPEPTLGQQWAEAEPELEAGS